MKKRDLVGMRFTRLVPIRESKSIRTASGDSVVRWLCKCDCGATLAVRAGNLLRGNTKSCGCFKSEVSRSNCLKRSTHGLRNHEVYKWWRGIKSRCFRKSDPAYKRYGGRGILPCAYISKSPENLLAVTGQRPPGHFESGRPHWTIDRKNNDWGYWCGSCDECVKLGHEKNIRWATALQQNQNHRGARLVKIGGVTFCVAEWVRRTGLSKNKVILMGEP